MHDRTPRLHVMCGKVASGKSTLAARLAAQPATILVAEDAWLAALFADELRTLEDYARCSGRLRSVLGPHVAAVLQAGVSVVLDVPANTRGQRRWFRELVEAAGADHVLHVLDVPDAVCLARLRARNAAGTHPFVVTEALFHEVTRHFAPPAPEEGFTILRHGAAGGDLPGGPGR